MKLHEYQAKQLIAKYNVPVPLGYVANSIDQAKKLASDLNCTVMVVKAQIHAGGRGKGGGVKLCHTIEEVAINTAKILFHKLITPQTGATGQLVNKVLIEQGTNIEKELYFSILIDRVKKMPVILASTEGGMDIEEVAINTPAKIFKTFINPLIGITNYQTAHLCLQLNIIETNTQKQAQALIKNLYQAFVAEDISLLEINPLVITDKGNVIALDCKIILDDNSLARHSANITLRDIDEEEPAEVEATKFDISYIKLNGNIGCMVNGAGLAMATMDIIKLHGGNPANFLDVGGNATQEKVENALRLICSDKNVTGIFINIFGGIVRCDMIASGILAALKNLKLNVPIVVRLQGNNADLAHEIIEKSEFSSKLKIIDDLTSAAKKIVEFSK